MRAEECLREGNLQEALSELQSAVRRDPSNAKYRVFLFQLLSVVGQWDRALTQLNVAGEMDASTLAMVQAYREALQCEMLRARIFAGHRSPLVFGEPEHWIALLIESLRLSATGQHAQAESLRQEAFDGAPAVRGTLTTGSDDAAVQHPFEWIADADSRLGPMLEAVVNGRYYWIPFHRIRRLDLEAPVDLRDVVWMPAYFTWSNGGETVGMIPTRYAGSESHADDAVRLARKTDWIEEAGICRGIGQRMMATEGGEFPLMEIRRIVLDLPASEPSAAEISAARPGSEEPGNG